VDRAQDARPSRNSGFTILEISLSVALLVLLTVGLLTTVSMTQRVFAESEVLSELTLRARNALDRVSLIANQAVTSDTAFTPLNPATGIDSHGFRFRQILSFDPTTGAPVFDDLWRVFVYGPDSGAFPSSGLVIIYGPDLGTMSGAVSGADGTFGTTDDILSIGGFDFVEVLIPTTYAPQTGDMVRFNFSPAPLGRLITMTLRLNARGIDGNFLLPQDLVITERIALKR
jgi:type II secretory pathway pseudopilin PulG